MKHVRKPCFWRRICKQSLYCRKRICTGFYCFDEKSLIWTLDSPRWRVGDPCFLLLRHDRPWNAWPQGGLNRVLGMRPCAVGQKWGLCPHRQKGLERRGEPRALSRLRNRLAARRPESRIRGGLGHGFTTLWPWARLSSSSPTRLRINDGIFMQDWLFKSIRYRYIIKAFSFPLLPGAGI